jgi:RimJ/RimL family protein N-acetyltransferase
VRLRPYTDADRWLTEVLETDPEVMADLGGPIEPEAVEPLHRRRMQEVESGGDPWWLVIVAEPEDEPAGTIGIWEAEHEGERIHETGWTVAPAFQGRGIATAALAELLERARASGEFDRLHAFPNVTNGASNALCRRAGFALVGEIDVVFRGAQLHCNHWVLEL